jgi:ribosome-binding factor A
MAQARRVFKVAAKVREVLAIELLGRAEPRFSLMTITSVVVSPDLRIAKIYWSAPSDVIMDREDVLEAIEDHTPSLRRVLAKKLGLRAVPELKFFFDETMDRVEEVERLFERVRAQDDLRVSKAPQSAPVGDVEEE